MTPVAHVDWISTRIRLDVICPNCSKRDYLDSHGKQCIRCPTCSTVFKMPDDLAIEKIDPPPGVA